MTELNTLEPRWPGNDEFVELVLNRNSKAATRKYYFDYHEDEYTLVFKGMKTYMPDTTAEESDFMTRRAAGREIIENTKYDRVLDEDGELIVKVQYGENYE